MLIATDLDGTLVRHDNSISPRCRAAIRAAEEAGIPVVPTTGRQIGGLETVLDAFSRYAVVSNGALAFDLAHDMRVLFSLMTPAATVRAFVETVLEDLPRAQFASVRQDGRVFAVTERYVEEMGDDELVKDPAEFLPVDLEDICSHDCLKLMVRTDEMDQDQFVAHTLALQVPGAHTSNSGFPMVEMCAAGHDKAAGLDRLCHQLGITRADVVALGDGGNDAEMLAWAGRSFAMADGQQLAKDAATDIAPPLAEDGFAQVVESLVEQAA
ncbi:hypothetical protein C0Z10_11125 [Acidipropionibacterium jensenii]|uniref:HAD family phosphatase n=1 Tax=Acidipropionibacterium jensenii TaxID=1749 RepID=A0A3Q9ULL6_9ACTN|nr:HAD-IIB family hydrolase [Acidipropionibacterium jensenii]AZZ40213.1 hypothetical protein C0Z10_11125 [Acidipropionibacterium jensenii]